MCHLPADSKGTRSAGCEKMYELLADNGFRAPLPGLARDQAFSSLSQKRVTKAVRGCLRTRYGEKNVVVSCSAMYQEGCWRGECEISGQVLQYEIRLQHR